MFDPQGRAPTAEGTLERTPLVHLLVYVADKAMTGTMVFTVPSDPPVQHGVYFREGAPAKIRTGEPVAFLGRVLLELGLLDDDGLDQSLVTLAESKGLHGEILLSAGRIDKAGLVAGLRAQISRKMAHLYDLPPETAYGFYADANLLDDWGGPELTPVEPLGLIWAAVRAHPNTPAIDSLLMRLGSTPLRLHESADVARFSLSAQEVAIVDLIRARRCTVGELLESGVAPERTVKMLVYTLLVTRHLDHGSADAPPIGVPARSKDAPASSSVALARVKLKSRLAAVPASTTAAGAPAREAPPRPPPPQAPRVDLTPEMVARKEEVLGRFAAIDSQDYFTILGVARDATEEQIQSAYFGLAKIWHPDRLVPELNEVRPQAQKCFARMTQAWETLGEGGRRKRYLDLLKDGAGTPEEQERISRILDATTDFQKAEVCFKKRDYVGAEEHVSRAYEADPDQGDYVALYVTLKAMKRDAGAPVEDLIDQLSSTILRNERCERAYFARGQLLKRAGRRDQAMNDFRVVATLNPRNVDAQREIRLHEMRRSGGLPPEPAPPTKPGKPGATKPAAGQRDSIFGMDIGKLFKR